MLMWRSSSSGLRVRPTHFCNKHSKYSLQTTTQRDIHMIECGFYDFI